MWNSSVEDTKHGKFLENEYLHGAREGHVGERVRCKSCGHVFRLPSKEEE